MKDDLLTDKIDVAGCSDCPNLTSCRSQIVNGVGPTNAEIVLVGEAPGANEDETGEPFVGRSGKVLNEALQNANLEREDIRITNCVRCRPPDNRDPHVSELDNCSKYLEEELNRINPTVVVPLGRIPVKQLLGDVGNVSDVVGSIHERDTNGWCGTVVVSVHPAATLYNRELRPKFDDTFKTIANIVKN